MTTTIDLGDLLTTKEAATLLGLKANTLEIYRHQGKGPPFLKLGNEHGSAVRYQRSVLAAWLAERSFTSTSAHTATVKAKRAPGFTVGPSAIPGPWKGTSAASSQPQGAPASEVAARARWQVQLAGGLWWTGAAGEPGAGELWLCRACVVPPLVVDDTPCKTPRPSHASELCSPCVLVGESLDPLLPKQSVLAFGSDASC